MRYRRRYVVRHVRAERSDSQAADDQILRSDRNVQRSDGIGGPGIGGRTAETAEAAVPIGAILAVGVTAARNTVAVAVAEREWVVGGLGSVDSVRAIRARTERRQSLNVIQRAAIRGTRPAGTADHSIIREAGIVEETPCRRCR